jgi:hypothetical protein
MPGESRAEQTNSPEAGPTGKHAVQTEPKLPPIASAPLSPNEHLAILIEMMRPTGAELARRWLATLTLVPREQREAVVSAVERQIVEEFGEEVGNEPGGKGY